MPIRKGTPPSIPPPHLAGELWTIKLFPADAVERRQNPVNTNVFVEYIRDPRKSRVYAPTPRENFNTLHPIQPPTAYCKYFIPIFPIFTPRNGVSSAHGPSKTTAPRPRDWGQPQYRARPARTSRTNPTAPPPASHAYRRMGSRPQNRSDLPKSRVTGGLRRSTVVSLGSSVSRAHDCALSS